MGGGIPSNGGDLFFDFGGTKTRFLMGYRLIEFKVTSILAPNDCSIRWGGGVFLLLSNVLDAKGEGWGLLGNLGAKFMFVCIVNFKLTSIIAKNV